MSALQWQLMEVCCNIPKIAFPRIAPFTSFVHVPKACNKNINLKSGCPRKGVAKAKAADPVVRRDPRSGVPTDYGLKLRLRIEVKKVLVLVKALPR